MSRRASAGPRAEDVPVPPGGRTRRVVLTVVAMLSLSLTLGALFGKRGFMDLLRYKRERTRLVAEIDALRRDIVVLEAQVAALESDPLAVERLAREELSLARPGEVVVFLEPPRIPRAATGVARD